MSSDLFAPVLDCAGRPLRLDRPRVVGILNVTPDSFSDGGAHADIDAAVAKAIAVRTAETKKNKETVDDSQKAQAAVTAALNVLKDFYAKAEIGRAHV